MCRCLELSPADSPWSCVLVKYVKVCEKPSAQAEEDVADVKCKANNIPENPQDALVPANQCVTTHVKWTCLCLQFLTNTRFLARPPKHQLKLPSKSSLAHNFFHHKIENFLCPLDFIMLQDSIKIKELFSYFTVIQRERGWGWGGVLVCHLPV